MFCNYIQYIYCPNFIYSNVDTHMRQHMNIYIIRIPDVRSELISISCVDNNFSDTETY